MKLLRRLLISSAIALACSSASAAPPAQSFGLVIGPTNATWTDPDGNKWTLSIPQAVTAGTLTLTPSSGITADGTMIMSTSSKGTLVTADGAWSFGTQLDAAGGHAVLLNGSQVGGFFGQAIEIANNGQAYLQGDTAWWLYSGGAFTGPVPQP